MRRFVASIFILLTLLAASCGSDEATTELQAGDLPAPSDDGGADATPSADGDQDSTPEASGITGSASGVERRLLNAAERSAAVSSMRYSLEMAMSGLADLGGEDVVIVVSGAVDEGGTRSEMTMDMSGALAGVVADPSVDEAQLAAMFAEPIEVRYDGDRVYMSSSVFSWIVPVDTPWVTFEEAGDSSGMDLGTEQVDPAELLVLLRGLGDAEIVGTEEIDGVTTTHVRGRFSADNVLDATADLEGMEDLLAELGPTGTTGFELAVFDVDVWIGDDDIVRRMRFGVDDLAALDPTADPDASMLVTLEISDIGEPVEITIPPADQVTDVDDLLGGFLG